MRRRWGPYDLFRRLGAGGMGEVYLAQRHDGKPPLHPVVVKRMHPHLTKNPTDVQRFRTEAQLVAELSHPHIVSVYESGQIFDDHFLAMEYIDGPSFQDLLKWATIARLRVPPWLTLSVAIAVLDALAYAHQLKDEFGVPRRILHRDVSGTNVLLSKSGDVKLADFGIARDETLEHLTMAGEIKGNLAYMAPERFQEVPIDIRSDLFSVGVLLWEGLAQRRLFGGLPSIVIIMALEVEPRPLLADLVKDVPGELDQVIQSSLEPKPDHRPESAQALRATLQDIQDRFYGSISPADLQQVIQQTLESEGPRTDSEDLIKIQIPRADRNPRKIMIQPATRLHQDAWADLQDQWTGISDDEEPELLPAVIPPRLDSTPVGPTRKTPAYEGRYPFWVRNHEGEEIGPYDYGGIQWVVRKETRKGHFDRLTITANREHWFSVAYWWSHLRIDPPPDPASLSPPDPDAQTPLIAVFAQMTARRATGRLLLHPKTIRTTKFRIIVLQDGCPIFVHAYSEDLQYPNLLKRNGLLPKFLLPEMAHTILTEGRSLKDQVLSRLGIDVDQHRTDLMLDRLSDLAMHTWAPYAFETTPTEPLGPPLTSSLLEFGLLAMNRQAHVKSIPSVMRPHMKAALRWSPMWSDDLKDRPWPRDQRNLLDILDRTTNLERAIDQYPQHKRALLILAYGLSEAHVLRFG